MMIATHASENKSAVILMGVAGLTASILVGAGEFMLQFSPLGGYEAADYAYFGLVPVDRMTIGYFLAVLAAPLYVAGYWHFFKMLEPAGRIISGLVFLLGGYSFVIGTAWISQRIFLGLTVHEIQTGADLKNLLAAFADLNEPLVNVLRIAMLVVAIAWTALILTGRSHYPRWMALFSPGLVLGIIFALYFTVPAIGLFILPNAMNAAHAFVFMLSLNAARKL
jgi:Family of unknown function (DUF6796)